MRSLLFAAILGLSMSAFAEGPAAGQPAAATTTAAPAAAAAAPAPEAKMSKAECKAKFKGDKKALKACLSNKK